MRANHEEPHSSADGPWTNDELRLPFNRVELAPQHTLGRTGRIWSMPYPLLACREMNPASPLLQINPEIGATIQNTCNFLKLNAPEFLSEFTRALWPSLSKHNQTTLQTILEHGPTQTAPLGRATIAHSPLLETIEVPSIGENHWAYLSHYELGHYKSVFDNYHEDCSQEARSDVGSILGYLRAYKDLAHSYTGPNLEAATTSALYRDPYYTCMALCVCDMKLPSHFLALIHHGIGLQFLLMTRTPAWHFRPKSPNPEVEKHVIAEAFQTFTSLYLEDFTEPKSAGQSERS